MNKSKRTGTTWESAVVGYLNDNGFPYAERRALAGSLDKGDVSGVPGVMVECKAEQKITLAAYMDEVVAETKNAGAQIGVAVVKRRNHPVAKAYVVMELSQFVEMIK